ncbi:MAG: signal recognition particle-docking protein FtsY [Desulfobacterales bacterium]
MRWFRKNKPPQEDTPVAAGEVPGASEDGPVPDDTPAPEAMSSGGQYDPADSASSASAADHTSAAKRTEPGEDTGGIFKRLRRGLAKTRKLLTTDLDNLFAENESVDNDMLADLEEILITADIGVQTAMGLIQRVSSNASRIGDAAELKMVLREEILDLLAGKPQEREAGGSRPHVIMVVGVNGVGKTTTIGKLAARFLGEKKKVLIAAADTFRAAAVEQLAIWAERSGADFVRHKDGADPAAVAYDGIEAACARNADVVLVDTAGRLHTKINLMEELKKIKRSMAKIMPDAPHEVLLVLDATTGQNALSQAKLFNEALGVTGIALTKLDGTAKGGIVISIHDRLNIPLQYVGVGETIEDLQVFDPHRFVEALF